MEEIIDLHRFAARKGAIFLILSIVVMQSVFADTTDFNGYRLAQPDAKTILPEVLIEISGLAIINQTTFACIQDEAGIVFFYDIAHKAIVKEFKFHIEGDYEGISIVGGVMYVLRSDGTLFEIVDYSTSRFLVNSYRTGIPANNNEGLCYDRKNNRLLIGSKSNVMKNAGDKDERMIFGFDLKSKALMKEPVYVFNVNAVKRFAMDNDIAMPETKTKGKRVWRGPMVKLRISAIAFHPVTDALYVLSAVDHMIIVFDRRGRIQGIRYLDPLLFNKAEGITFFQNGDMLISNEGQDRRPTVLRFNYRGK